MTRPQLKVQERTVLGRKVKRLRRDGIIPANIYGKKISSEAVQIDASDFRELYSKASESTVIDLFVGKSKKDRPVLVREIQSDPVSGEILHIDFQQVDLKEEIEAEVIVRLKGEPDLVIDKQAMLIQELNELEVKSTPDLLPEEIVVDITLLKAIGDALRVKDLKTPEKVVILTDPERVVARLDELISEEAEHLAEEEAAAAAEAAAEAEAETPAEEAPVEEPKKEPEEESGEYKTQHEKTKKDTR